LTNPGAHAEHSSPFAPVKPERQTQLVIDEPLVAPETREPSGHVRQYCADTDAVPAVYRTLSSAPWRQSRHPAWLRWGWNVPAAHGVMVPPSE